MVHEGRERPAEKPGQDFSWLGEGNGQTMGQHLPAGGRGGHMTNADKIRAMSDEELAVFLDDLTCLCVDCNDHDGVNENCPIYKQGCGRYCEPKDLMDWLQQPAEEEILDKEKTP